MQKAKRRNDIVGFVLTERDLTVEIGLTMVTQVDRDDRESRGKTRAHAYRWLLDHNYPTYDFKGHLPQPIESGKFLETEREVQMMATRYRNWECVYLNSHHAAEAEDWGRRYLRVTRKRDSIQTRHKLLNHTHSQFRGAVENLLASLFPNPSAVEK